MAEKFACMQCGFVFDDPDMEVCPRCGTELGKEWSPDELLDVWITDISGADVHALIDAISEISGYPTQKIGPMLKQLPVTVFSGATPMQAEFYLEKIRAVGAAAMAESARDRSARLTAEAEARVKVDAETQVALAEAEAKKAQAEAEAKKAEAKAATEARARSDAEAKKAEAQAKVKKAEAEMEAAKALAEARAKAEREAEMAKADAEKARQQEEWQLAEKRKRAESSTICSKCGKIYEKSLKFCPECGTRNRACFPIRFVCQKCGQFTDSAAKICQNCGGRLVKEDFGWLEDMISIQKSIVYPRNKLCDVEIKPSPAVTMVLREYMMNHMGYFFQKVEEGDGLVFTGRDAITTPASSEDILRHKNPRTKKCSKCGLCVLYLKINTDAAGAPVNYSLYLVKRDFFVETPSSYNKVARVICAPLELVFIAILLPLALLCTLFKKTYMPCALMLNTMDLSRIPGSKVKKLRIKSLSIYCLLALYLGFLGLHNFYVGNTRRGLIQLVLGLTGAGILISWPWAWWEHAFRDDEGMIGL